MSGVMNIEDIARKIGVHQSVIAKNLTSGIRKLRDGFFPGVPDSVVIDYIQAVVDEHKYPIACGSVECDRGYAELYAPTDVNKE